MNRNELYLAKYLGISCWQCGREWKPYGQKRGPAPKFCSNACRQKYYRSTRNTTTPAGSSGRKPGSQNQNL